MHYNYIMKVISYSRVSTAHHEQKPEIQVNEIRRFCDGRDWRVDHEIVDHGFSGSTDNRPGYKELMRLVRSKEVDCVVVLKLDRLFRSLKHLVSALEEFESLGVQFVAIRDNVDYSTPSGRLFVQILGSLGEFERSLLRERTLMGLEHARKQGKTFGRPRVHNEAKIIQLHDRGMTYRQIQSTLKIPMGSIARAIKSARKSPPKMTLDSESPPVPQTVVLRADEVSSLSVNPYMSDCTDITDGIIK